MSLTHEIHQMWSNEANNRSELEMIDAHIHLVDFHQGSDGLEKLLVEMEKSNIKKAVAFGLPVKKKWEEIEPEEPLYYLDDNARCYYYSMTDELIAAQYQSLSQLDQKKIAPLICGFNPTDKLAIDHLEHMYTKYPFWKGVGEILLRHDDLSSLTLEETARINHQALKPIFEFCLEKNMPVLFHQNITSVNTRNEYKYANELREVFREFYDLKFVWAHSGISRRVSHPRYYEELARFADEFPNLYFDISWVIYDNVICTRKNHNIPKNEWIDLFNTFSTRFMIGSDLTGHYEILGKAVSRYNRLFDQLPIETAKNIAYNNADAIWFSE